ncbi:MAG: hypothetical protein ACOVOC_16335, partial [Rhabdaerophilum sp.]
RMETLSAFCDHGRIDDLDHHLAIAWEGIRLPGKPSPELSKLDPRSLKGAIGKEPQGRGQCHSEIPQSKTTS